MVPKIKAASPLIASRTSAPARRSSKCLICSISSSSKRAKSPLCSTATAARESAACARSISTVIPTALCRASRPVSSTCASSTTATQSLSSRGARPPSPLCATLWSTAMPSTRSSRPAAMCRSTAAVPRMPTLSPSRKRLPTRLWTRLPASVAAPVWLPARTVRQCSSSALRSASSHCCPRARLSASAVPAQWSRRWTNSDSVTAPIPEPAPPSAPRISR